MMFLTHRFLSPWRRSDNFLRNVDSVKPHRVTSQGNEFVIVTALKTSNLTIPVLITSINWNVKLVSGTYIRKLCLKIRTLLRALRLHAIAMLKSKHQNKEETAHLTCFREGNLSHINAETNKIYFREIFNKNFEQGQISHPHAEL
jgi:hypothetical protein